MVGVWKSASTTTKYPQIRTGQVWVYPDNGLKIHVDEVLATDVWSSGDWRAIVRYTVMDGREPDAVTAREFGDWIRNYRFMLEEAKE